MSRYIQKIIKDVKQDITLSGNSVVISNTHAIDGHQVAPFVPGTVNNLTGYDITGSTNFDTGGTTDYPVTTGDIGTPGAPPYNYEVAAPSHESVIIATVKRFYREAIRDYSEENLEYLEESGAKVYAKFDDETEVEVFWSEVFNPRRSTSTASFNIAEIAAANNQHFWTDTNGAHVTSDLRRSWDDEYAEPDHGTLATPTLQNPWHNILLNSMGILLRKGLINLAAMESGSIAFYDGLGNDSTNINAVFGSQGAQIGKDTDMHVVLDSSGLAAYDANGDLAPIQSSNIAADYAEIRELKNTYADIFEAYITYLDAGEIEATDITAMRASVERFKAGTATVGDLTAMSGFIDMLVSHRVTSDYIRANYAEIEDLDAVSGKFDNVRTIILAALQADIDSLTADEIEALDITAVNAAIENLETDQLSANDITALRGVIETLASHRITTDILEANYAQINLANVNNAWIANGVIKQGAIGDAQIVGVSANKLTAGEINADEIMVRNLRAENLKVGRLNGQPVIGGYSVVSTSSTGYAQKNPTTEGWYEYVNGAYVLSQDTSVRQGVVYYTQDTQVALYDQTTIDGMFDNVDRRIDSQIQTHTGSVVPTLSNSPASSWNTNALKDEHIGDIYYVINAGNQADGYTYRFAYDNATSSYKWILIKDNQVTAALQDLIDVKGDISDLQEFQSDTATWINETDEGLETIRQNHSTLVTNVNNGLASKVDTTTFNTVANTVNENSSTITTLSTKIDNIQIGGRNLLLYTGTLKKDVDPNGISSYGYPESLVETENGIRLNSTGQRQESIQVPLATHGSVKNGEKVVLSFEARGTLTYPGRFYWIQESGGNPYINNWIKDATWLNGSGSFSLNETEWTKFVIDVTHDSSNDGTCRAILMFYALENQGQEGKWIEIKKKSLKLEKGTRATDWTPAPEEMASDESVTTVTNLVNQVKQTADTNSAKLTSFTKTVNGLDTRLSTAETSITQHTNDISLRATQTEVTNAINNIQIGSRNLLLHTDTLKKGYNPEGIMAYTNKNNSDCLVETENGLRLNSTGVRYESMLVPLATHGSIKNGEKVVLSFEARGTLTYPGSFYWIQANNNNQAIENWINNTNNRWLNGSGSFSLNEIEWTKFVIDVTHSSSNNGTCTGILIFFGLENHSQEGKWVEIKKKSLKLEKGTKATDWTPAPEEMASQALVDGIVIGGRNLLLGTDAMKKVEAPSNRAPSGGISTWAADSNNCLEETSTGLKLTGANKLSECFCISLSEAGIIKHNDEVTLSFTARGNIHFIGTLYWINQASGESNSLSSWLNGSNSISLSTDTWTDFSTTFKVSSTHSSNIVSLLIFYNLESDNSGKWIEIKKKSLKLEKGNKATSWTPAPEEMQTVAQSQAELQVTNTAINAKVSKTDYTGATVASMINQSADSVKIQAKHVEIDGTAIFNNTNFQSLLNNKFESDGVSGRNLLLGTALYDSTAFDSLSGSNIETENGILTHKDNGSSMGNRLNRIAVNPGETYTFSFEIKSNFSASFGVDDNGLFVIDISSGETYNRVTSWWLCSRQPYTTSTSWSRIVYTFTIPSNNSITSLYIGLRNNKYTEGYIYQLRKTKIEKGSKATYWTPAPEDIIASAPKAKSLKRSQRIYYRSNSTTKPAKPASWVAEASSNVYNAWSTKVSPIASNKEANTTKYLYLYTCEQRETVSGEYSCTSVQLDENTTVIDGGNIITNSVTAEKLNAVNINASNSLTVGALSTDAQNMILNSKISIGGTNLIRNTLSFSNYSCSSASFDYGYSDAKGGSNAIKITPSSTGWWFGTPAGNIFNKVGEEYVVSVYLKAESNTTCYLNGRDIKSSSYRYNNGATRQLYNITTEWQRFYIAGSCISLASASGTNIWIGQSTTVPIYTCYWKVEKGNKPTDWSPAPEDVDTGISNAAKTATDYITHVDNNGIKVHAVNNTTSNYSLINANGMTVYKGGNQVASFGDTVLLGSTSSQGARVNSSGLQIFKGGSQIASFGDAILLGSTSGQGARVNSDGVQIFKGGSQIASFGTDVTIGKNNDTKLMINSNELYFTDTKGNKAFSIAQSQTNSNYGSAWVEYFIGDGSTKKFNLKYTASIINDAQYYTITFFDPAGYISYTRATKYIEFSSALPKDSIVAVAYFTNDIYSFSYNLGTGNTSPKYLGGFSFGNENAVNNSYSVCMGSGLTVQSPASAAFGAFNYITFSAPYAFASGIGNNVLGEAGYAEGLDNSSSGIASHAEGCKTRAEGSCSHTEGFHTTAKSYAHAGGKNSIAGASCTFVHGEDCSATGAYSVVFGKGCNDGSKYANMLVSGMYNSPTQNDYFEIGNGSSDTYRSNAFRVTKNSVAYVGSSTVSSDIRVKSDISDLNVNDAYEFVSNLKPKSYIKFERRELGFIAQDIEKLTYGDILVDESPNYGYNDFKNLSYDGLIAPLVATVQILQKENEELKQKNQELENRLARLEAILLKDGDI